MAEHGQATMEYSVDFGEGDQRTLSVREIATEYANGTITRETYVWTDGFADWKPLGEVAELFRAVTAAKEAKSSPRSSAARAAARSAVGRSATADLFGSIDSAGSDDEVQTSAPQQDSGGSSTGSRNESSVLFSLSALTSQANQRPSTRPAATSSSRDDSGLIDLKALTAAAMKSDTGAAAAPIAPAVPVAPFGVPGSLGGIAAPLGGVTSTTDIAGAGSKSRAPLYIGGGLAVGMVAIALAIVLRPVPPPPAPIVVAAPPPPAQAAPTPAPEPTQDAQPPATAGATEPPAPETDKDKPETKKAATRAHVKRSSSSSSSSKKTETATETPASKPAAAPKKSSGGCGCASGDLQCAIRCAAK